MNTFDHPLFLSFCLFVGLWLSMRGGAALHRLRKLQPDEQPGFNIILTATLTLLSLILGFSFSMAISRYDQRKGYEEAEANAISAEYTRAELLPAADAARVQGLLRTYLAERVSFYETGDRQHLPQIKGETLRIQNELWAAVKGEAATQTTAPAILVVSGMNDVINSQGRAQGSCGIDPDISLDPDDDHRRLLQPAARFRRAQRASSTHDFYGAAVRDLDCVLPDCGK